MWRLWKGCRGFTRIMPGLEETYKERLDCFLWNSGQWRKTWVHNIMKGIDRVDSQNPFFQRWKYQILEDTGNPLIFWRLIDPSPPLIRTNLWAHLKFPPEVPSEMWRQDWVRPLISTWVQSSAARVSALRVLWVCWESGAWPLGHPSIRPHCDFQEQFVNWRQGCPCKKCKFHCKFNLHLILVLFRSLAVHEALETQ